MASKSYVPAGKGEDFDYSQDHCFIKSVSEFSDGSMVLVEDELKPGFYLARHHHKIMTEVFYILEGEVEFTFDDEVIAAKPGDTVTAPPNVWHAAKCEKGGRMLTVFRNGRFDKYLERLSKMADTDFQDEQLMKQTAAEFDIYEE